MPERLVLAFNINDGGARDAEWPMRKQIWHILWKKLCRFYIERKESLVHGAIILHGNTLQRSVWRACSEGAGIADLSVDVR